MVFFANDPADGRFLSRADRLFSEFTDLPFVAKKLTVSYRTTEKIANFVNFVTRDDPTRTLLRPGNTNNRDVQVVVDNPSSGNVVKMVRGLIEEYGPENVMILSQSTKARGVQNIVNSLTRHFNFYVSSRSAGTVDNRVLKDKVLVQTYCGCKGLERKCVIVFSISASHYFQNVDINQVYVALTRSSGGRLLVIQDAMLPLYPGFGANLEALGMYTKIECKKPFRPRQKKSRREQEEEQEGKERMYPLEDMCDFVETGLLMEAVQRYITVTNLVPPKKEEGEDEKKKQTKVQFGPICEDVSSLIAHAMPMVLEYQSTGTIKAAQMILEPVLAHSRAELEALYKHHGKYAILQETYKKAFPAWKVERFHKMLDPSMVEQESTTEQAPKLTMAQIMEIANGTRAYSKYHHTLQQISHYRWVDESLQDLSPFYALMANRTGTPRFHETCTFTKHYPLPSTRGPTTIVGHCDLLLNDTDAWTFAWTSQLKIEQLLRCALTMCLTGQKTGYLYNFKTWELIQVEINTPEQRIAFIEYMIYAKEAKPQTLSDEEFFQKCLDS